MFTILDGTTDSPTTDAAFRGFLDVVRHRTVVGWASDGRAVERAVALEVIINGVHAGSTVADRFRPDLHGAGVGNGRHGFEFVVPSRFERIDTVDVLVSNTSEKLPRYNAELIEAATNRPLPSEWRDENGHQRFPSLFILGAAKSGTTSLHFYLSQCENVLMSQPKEPFFFEAEWQHGPPYYFNKYFGGWHGQKVVGEARHRNLYLPHVPARIHAYNPNARLIAILRNPVERAISHWWHWYWRRIEERSLRDALHADLRRMQAERDTDKTSEVWMRQYGDDVQINQGTSDRSYLESGHYLEQIERYARLFPREQLRIILADDLARDPKLVMAETLTFLGLPVNQAAHLDYALCNKSRPGMQRHADAETVGFLQDYYRARNAELGNYLGRSLAHWNGEPALAES